MIKLILVGLVAVTYGSPAKGSTKASLKKKPCMKDCGDNYKPVCAGDGKDKPRSYGSECVLSNFNCESGNGKFLCNPNQIFNNKSVLIFPFYFNNFCSSHLKTIIPIVVSSNELPVNYNHS